MEPQQSDIGGCLERLKRARNGVWTGFGGKIWPKTGAETAKCAKNAKKRAENGIKTGDFSRKTGNFRKTGGTGAETAKFAKNAKNEPKTP